MLARSSRTPIRPGTANRLDPEALTILLDKRADFGRFGASSPAKTRSPLEDLIHPAQMRDLTAQLLELLSAAHICAASQNQRPATANVSDQAAISEGSPLPPTDTPQTKAFA
jgi:hypothetical protein